MHDTICVRVALGAEPRDVLRFVMRRAAPLVAAGMAIGCGASLALGRLVAGLLYGVTPRDPFALLAAAAFVLAVAACAMYVPARRASRVDPLVALRSS